MFRILKISFAVVLAGCTATGDAQRHIDDSVALAAYQRYQAATAPDSQLRITAELTEPARRIDAGTAAALVRDLPASPHLVPYFISASVRPGGGIATRLRPRLERWGANGYPASEALAPSRRARQILEGDRRTLGPSGAQAGHTEPRGRGSAEALPDRDPEACGEEDECCGDVCCGGLTLEGPFDGGAEVPDAPIPDDPIPDEPLPLPLPDEPVPDTTPLPLPLPDDPIPDEPLPLPLPDEPVPDTTPLPLPLADEPIADDAAAFGFQDLGDGVKLFTSRQLPSAPPIAVSRLRVTVTTDEATHAHDAVVLHYADGLPVIVDRVVLGINEELPPTRLALQADAGPWTKNADGCQSYAFGYGKHVSWWLRNGFGQTIATPYVEGSVEATMACAVYDKPNNGGKGCKVASYAGAPTTAGAGASYCFQNYYVTRDSTSGKNEVKDGNTVIGIDFSLGAAADLVNTTTAKVTAKLEGKAEGKQVGGNGQVTVKFDHPGGSYGGIDVAIDGELICPDYVKP